MSRWAIRIGHFLLIGALFVSLGGHLVVFQTIAWANMLQDFSRAASFEEAARKTFDGEHPCPLCKAVRESKQQEDKKSLLKAESKMEVALPVPVRLKAPRSAVAAIPVFSYFGSDSKVWLAVPLQPPRGVL